MDAVLEGLAERAGLVLCVLYGDAPDPAQLDRDRPEVREAAEGVDRDHHRAGALQPPLVEHRLEVEVRDELVGHGLDPDQLAVGVDEGPSGVAGVDRRIGLQEAVVGVVLGHDRAIER